jgi:hypothetical protein
VRIAVMKMLHGMGTTRYLPREFFETNEYRHIMALSAKLDDLLGEDAFISRGDRQGAVEHFSEAVDWLMNEARRGQSVQRYKGLGEMNPDQLWDTTVNPETRRLMQVKIEEGRRDLYDTYGRPGRTTPGIHREERPDGIEPRRLGIAQDCMEAGRNGPARPGHAR